MYNMYDPPHPGEVLKELYLKPLRLSVTTTAQGLNVSRKALSELVNKKFGVSPEMALRLAKAFSTTPELWLNLQQQYDLWEAKTRHTKQRVRTFLSPTKKVEMELRAAFGN